jgi:hypothetical protein
MLLLAEKISICFAFPWLHTHLVTCGWTRYAFCLFHTSSWCTFFEPGTVSCVVPFYYPTFTFICKLQSLCMYSVVDWACLYHYHVCFFQFIWTQWQLQIVVTLWSHLVHEMPPMTLRYSKVKAKDDHDIEG